MPYTSKGLEYALHGTAAPNGAIANLGTKLKLYTSASTPAADGTGFTEVANGNGYTTGGKALSRSNYTFAFSAPNATIVIADQTWTASGPISNVAGAYLTDASDNVLAWFPRGSTASIDSPDQIVADDLTLQIAAT
jgi:hypothetical protein